jgi:uncharacterized membrane protein
MTKTTKRLVIALAASVAVNLFLGGFLTSRAFMHKQRRDHRTASGPFLGPRGLLGPGGLANATPEVKNVLEQHREGLRNHRRRMHEARRAVAEALRAEPFERGRLEQALADARTATDASQAAMHAALVEVAATVGPEERRKLARASKRHRRK